MDVSKLVDAYTARARLLPGLLTVLPIAVTVYAWEPGNALGWNGLGGLLTGFGGTILLSFIARDLGKRAEDRLYRKWGGRPSELMLMHSGPMAPVLRARRHAAIRALFPDVPVPTAAEEAAERGAAQDRFRAITTLLIGRSRNKEKHPLLFEENCNYGFRRNMYGMRWLGVATAAVTTLALGLQIYTLFLRREHLAVMSLALEAVNGGMLLVWIFWVNEQTVQKGAELYAERLFETLDTVPPQV